MHVVHFNFTHESNDDVAINVNDDPWISLAISIIFFLAFVACVLFCVIIFLLKTWFNWFACLQRRRFRHPRVAAAPQLAIPPVMQPSVPSVPSDTESDYSETEV